MPSTLALRALLGASLGLGVLDLVWINVALAPELTEAAASEPIREARPRTATVHEEAGRRVAEREVAGREVATTDGEATRALASDDEADGDVATGDPAPRVVYFASRSAVLGDRARAALGAIVRDLPAGSRIVLEGHADYRGDEQRNRQLSRQRAETVATQLRELGVAGDRVQVRYVGEARARLRGDATELWRDRRVDIQIEAHGPAEPAAQDPAHDQDRSGGTR